MTPASFLHIDPDDLSHYMEATGRLARRVKALEEENQALRVALADERVAKRRALRRALDLKREKHTSGERRA